MTHRESVAVNSPLSVIRGSGRLHYDMGISDHTIPISMLLRN